MVSVGFRVNADIVEIPGGLSLSNTDRHASLSCIKSQGSPMFLRRYERRPGGRRRTYWALVESVRTGRIDRLACKAELKQPIHVYLPYLSGTADERQFHVMTDREQWFRIVIGEDEVAKLIPCDDDHERPQLLAAFSQHLTFSFGIRPGLLIKSGCEKIEGDGVGFLCLRDHRAISQPQNRDTRRFRSCVVALR